MHLALWLFNLWKHWEIDRGKECSDSTEDLEPVEEDEPLISESEPEDDASDDEEEALDLDWIIYKIDM